MMKKLISFIMIPISVLFLPQVSYASLPSGTDEEELDEEVEDFMDEHDDITAGVMFAVFTPEEILHETYEGEQNIEDDAPVTEDSVFEWGSITKLLTWISIMQLAEQDLIDLDTDIHEYLPEDFLDDFEEDEEVTILNLMNHQGGFRNQIPELFVPELPDDYSFEDEVADKQPPQSYEPGEVTEYSNWGAALAGYIVEEVSEQPFHEYVHENILEPLNMEDTAVAPDLSDNPDIRDAHEDTNGYFPASPPTEDEQWYMPLYPAGSAVSTLDDLVTFAQALFPSNEDSPLFDTDNTLVSMFETTDHFDDTEAPRNAHGFNVVTFQNAVYGHSGNTNSFSSNLLLDIEEETGYVVMINQAQESTYTALFPEIIFGDYTDSDEYEDNINFNETFYQSAGGYMNGLFSTLNSEEDE